jgi:hypothetical protein
VEEALFGLLARDERLVGRIDVARDERRGIGICAGDDQRRNAQEVGRETRRDEVADRGLGRDENLAAEVAALLLRRELIFEVDARGAGFDERLHDLVHVERAAEAGFRIRNDREIVIDVFFAFALLDLVRALERIVEALHEHRGRIRRIQALVGVGLHRDVTVGGNLPAREIDRLKAGLRDLNGLAAGQRAERVDVRLVAQRLKKAFGTEARERVFDVHRSAQTDDVRSGIRALDAGPTGVGLPHEFELGGVGKFSHGCLFGSSSECELIGGAPPAYQLVGWPRTDGSVHSPFRRETLLHGRASFANVKNPNVAFVGSTPAASPYSVRAVRV